MKEIDLKESSQFPRGLTSSNEIYPASEVKKKYGGKDENLISETKTDLRNSEPLSSKIFSSELSISFEEFPFNKTIPSQEFDIYLSEGTTIRGWKIVENVSARLLEFTEESVLLECLIDKEFWVYEEREFKKSLFDGYELIEGKFFKLCTYERANQIMMEVIDNPKLILDSDFPKSSFAEKYNNLTLKKRN